MAKESPLGTTTFLASTGLKQYQFVDLDAAGVLINPTTNGRAIGVLISSGTTGSTGKAGSTTSGYYHTVQYGGIAKVLSGSSAIPIAGFVKASTDGRASTGTSTNAVNGIFLSAGVSTSTVSEVVHVLLFPYSGTLA